MKITGIENILDKVLHYIGKLKSPTFIVQIGAMDGESFDDIVGYINAYDWSGLYVEPIPYYFNKLVRYKKLTDLFEQAAIVEQDGLVEMVTVDRTPIETGEIHPGFAGMSAVTPPRNGFVGGEDKQILERFGRTIFVNGITLDTLFKKHNISSVDIFLCDAEGYDWLVFKQLDLQKIRPTAIRLEWINLSEEEKKLVIEKLDTNNYVYELNGSDIDAISKEFWKTYCEEHNIHTEFTTTPNLTVVSGLWDIQRVGRSFDQYIENFKKILNTPVNLYLYIPSSLEHMVWENPIRTKTNTFIKITELEHIRDTLYNPFWKKTQKIRTSDQWTNQAGWLKESPQATNEWYNPIVQSKMFMLHDAKLINPFNTDYFVWLDAGITNTVYEKLFTENRCFDKIIPYLSTFLFLSYPYEASNEIHGFDFKEMNSIAKTHVKYVCRGGLFGGHKDFISQANALYYSLLDLTLNKNLMGTEESIFSIMANLEPHIYRRYSLDDNGLVVKFIQALINDTIELEKIDTIVSTLNTKYYNKHEDKTSLYVLSFNFPEQFETLLKTFEQHPEWIERPEKFLINNSTDRDTYEKYDSLCKKYGFEHIQAGTNLGINRGRYYAAKHFQERNNQYYYFFEDDMCLHEKNVGSSCRNGFKTYVPDLFDLSHEILVKENLDFLKLSYTEVYMDNNIQVSWYNVPQSIRSELWPEYDQLPITGLDPNSPRTKFNKIDVHRGISYAVGDVYYANWPMLVSRDGNYKMFLETEWANPYEQTWMSYIFQETLKGNIKPAVLLASPINHNRISHYSPEERREN